MSTRRARSTLASVCEAAAAHPDAALLHLGAEFDQLYAAWLPIHAEMWRLHSQHLEEWEKTGLSIDENLAAYFQLRTKIGLDAVIEASEKALDPIDAVATKIRETPAKTFGGLAVKARVLAYDAGLDMRDLPEEKLDGPEKAMNQFIAELDRLVSTGNA